MGPRLARFEALSLSPRCAASATWSDARGLRQTVFEDQTNFYTATLIPPVRDLSASIPYGRNYAMTRGYCDRIDSMASKWAAAAEQSSQNPGGQPTRVSYVYDPLQQLTRVDYPLDDETRATITTRFDLLGRTLDLQEPNSGCTHYEYDGLSTLTSESSFRYEPGSERPCGTSFKLRNQKSYAYSGGRLRRISYHSLDGQGSAIDDGDAVNFYYDRFPYAVKLWRRPRDAAFRSQ